MLPLQLESQRPVLSRLLGFFFLRLYPWKVHLHSLHLICLVVHKSSLHSLCLDVSARGISWDIPKHKYLRWLVDWMGTAGDSQGGIESISLRSLASSKKKIFSAALCLFRYLDWAKGEHPDSTCARVSGDSPNVPHETSPFVVPVLWTLFTWVGVSAHRAPNFSDGMGRSARPISQPSKASSLT